MPGEGLAGYLLGEPEKPAGLTQPETGWLPTLPSCCSDIPGRKVLGLHVGIEILQLKSFLL